MQTDNSSRLKQEIDALTGEVIVRPFTDEENAQADLDALEPVTRANKDDTTESLGMADGD